jgi:hypothetical protein
MNELSDNLLSRIFSPGLPLCNYSSGISATVYPVHASEICTYGDCEMPFLNGNFTSSATFVIFVQSVSGIFIDFQNVDNSNVGFFNRT